MACLDKVHTGDHSYTYGCTGTHYKHQLNSFADVHVLLGLASKQMAVCVKDWFVTKTFQ